MRTINFKQSAFQDYTEWGRIDKKMQEKIETLIKDILRNPFDGLGKPEMLKHSEYKECWSRRITQEHRLVYSVSEQSILIIACKFHYQ
jgi:toxin YoeB